MLPNSSCDILLIIEREFGIYKGRRDRCEPVVVDS